MRVVVATVCLLACNGGSNGVTDGGRNDAGADSGVDAPADGPGDAPPDAMPQCASPDDRDGDGICDSLDLCPDAPDPGQADLDGDHIGWMCDPVESITLPTLGGLGYVQTSIHVDTFAARTKIDCPSGSPPCGHVVLQVSAAGMLLTRWDSTAPIDAWQAAPTVTWMDGPLVTADDRVLWSRGLRVGDTGDYDLATRVFTPRATGVLNPDDLNLHAAVYAGSQLLAAGLSTAADALTQNLVDVLGDGTLPTVATAQGFTGFVGGADSIGLAGSPARALVPVRVQFHVGLALYTHGAAALAPILANGASLDVLADLEGLAVDGRRIAFCAQRGSDVFAVGVDASGQIAVHQLPIADCLAVTATDRGDARLFFKSGALVGYTFAGAFHALATRVPPEIIGHRPPLLVNSTEEVLLIADDGSSSLVSSGFDNAVAAMSGTTIHVLAHVPDPTDRSGLNASATGQAS